MIRTKSGQKSAHITITITITIKEKNISIYSYIRRRRKMAKRTGSNTWNWEMRKNLEFLVSEEGYPPKKIAKELSVSDATVYLELKRGMTAEEYLNKRY